MDLSPIVTATVQAAFLTAVSNVLAQLITAYREDADDMWIDWIPVFRFVLFAMISTPPNFLWQQFLESSFPAHPPSPAKHPKKSDDAAPPPPAKLSVRNTVAKLLLDQTVSASANTLLFSTFNSALRAATSHAPRITDLRKAVSWWSSPGAVALHAVDYGAVWGAALEEFWPLLTASWQLWPAVSLLNFTLVKTVQMRNLVGNLAGLGWGVRRVELL